MLEQIQAQTFQPDEVIVIDDASTDGSVEHVRNNFPSVKLVENDKNLGVIKNVNRGTSLAQGKYIIYLAADDWIFPGFFEQSVRALEENPNAGLCTGNMAFFSEESPPYHFRYSELKRIQEGYYSPIELQKLMRNSPFFIYTTASCYRREGIPLQNEKYGFVADWEMNMKIAFDKGIVYLTSLFGACRTLENSFAASSKRSRVLRSEIFESLILDFQKRGGVWEEEMKKGGLLSHLGVKMVEHVATRPRHWRYFPTTFMKKWQFYLNSKKLKQR